MDAGVTTVINVGVDVDLSKKALEQVNGTLADIPNLKAYSTIGIHPHESVKYLTNPDLSLDKDIASLEEIYLSDKTKVVAVGECGLDYLEVDEKMKGTFFPSEIKDMQKRLFQAQIDLARKLNLPLIVHCRDDKSKDPSNSEAWDEILEMISDHPTILHCYSGLDKTTQKVLKMPNTYVSFAATITYPKNDYLREAAKLLPLEKIVLETDCPFLPPQSKRGQRNEPAFVYEIAQLVADLKGISLEEVSAQTTANTVKIFAFPS